MEDLVIDRRIRIMAVFCEHGAESSGSIKAEDFFFNCMTIIPSRRSLLKGVTVLSVKVQTQ
jgi:hypothetical protein